MPRLSVRLSEEDMEWVKKQGRASDVCKRLISEHREKDGVSLKTWGMFRQILESIKGVDSKAKDILNRLPEPTEDDNR